MAALPYQFTVPRRRVLGSASRTAICVTLAITSLMAAAMTWTPSSAAAACAGASSSSETCQNTGIPVLTTVADAVGLTDIPRVSRITTQSRTSAHAIKKTVYTRQTATTSSGTSSGTSYATATGGLPCQQSYMFVPNISQWTVPPGCYGKIYYPDRSVYYANSNFGFCNWWVLALHPNQPDILYGKEYTRSGTPVAGAAVWLDPYVQGASSAGHWAQAVAVSPNGYWVLITEMNFYWNGGGWGRVDFRYIHVGPGVVFIH